MSLNNNIRISNRGINFNSKLSSNNKKSSKFSKFNIKKYKILNNLENKKVRFGKIDHNFNPNFNTIDTTSQKSKNILFSKNDMPFIPSKERQKGELHFIQLIKSLMNTNHRINSNNNQSNSKINEFYKTKISDIDPYKPKGYNFYEYSREHPGLINDNNNYMKLLQELNKNYENEEKKEKERCLSYIDIKKENNNSVDKLEVKKSLNKTKNIYNIKLNTNIDNNNAKVMPNSKSYSKYVYTLDNNNYFNSINCLNNNENLKTDRANLKTHNAIDNKDINNNNKDKENFPLIKSLEIEDSLNNYQNNKINKMNFFRKKDYNKSDIFNLKEDILNLKASNQYLFKNNYMPLKKYSGK